MGTNIVEIPSVRIFVISVTLESITILMIIRVIQIYVFVKTESRVHRVLLKVPHHVKIAMLGLN